MPDSRSDAERGARGSMVGPIIFGVVGLTLGAGFGESLWGAFSGAALGVLYANFRSIRVQLAALQQVVSDLEVRERDRDRDSAAEAQGAGLAARSPLPDSGRGVQEGIEGEAIEGGREEPSLEEAVSAAFSERLEPAPPDSPGSPVVEPVIEEFRVRRPAAGPTIFDRAVSAVRTFFFGGNTVVRVGLLVLLVGISLLAKYAADNALFPVELRLAFAALVGLALVGVGFRLRAARPGFGMSLQGGGVAALYLVTFFAFRMYGLLPPGLAFGLFVALALATALLAHLQGSEALLVIGSLGGFLAPILATTGEGNHVALFSYYLILNVSIAAVAWRQTWRIPALVAFVCTYAVATTWGVLRYEPDELASTEPFVLAFLVLFTAIAVLHAWRRPPHLRGLVDGTLVFGTPFVSILFEAALVRERELGLALAAAGFGLFYAATAVFVWRVAARELRPLAEAFVALAVGFATMAIPFAFDESLTTAVAWALEGAGLYWIGARQSRAFPRFAGIVLQGLAALAFASQLVFGDIDSTAFLPIANGRALSCLSLAMAGVFIARQAYRQRDRLRPIEMRLTQALGIWGLLWWSAGSLAEIDQFMPDAYQPAACVVWLAATAFLLELGSARWRWEPGRTMALASLPGAILLFLAFADSVPHLLADGGWLAWPPMFVALFFLWERLNETRPHLTSLFRAGSLWFSALFAAMAFSGLVGVGAGLANDWEVAAFGVGLAGVLLGSTLVYSRGRAPFDRDPEAALFLGLAPVAGFALVTILGIQFEARGDASPLPHLPLLNPVDLTVWLLALSVWRVWTEVDRVHGDSMNVEQKRMVGLVSLAVAFAAMNGILVRAVHQWANVRFSTDALWDSVAMQVTLSIAWTLVGMVGMLLASRRGWRRAWMGFAGLLGVVVVKLFTVDLSQLSTLARIGTFLAVGALLLVLGYLSPVPPGGGKNEATGSPDPSDPPESPWSEMREDEMSAEEAGKPAASRPDGPPTIGDVS